MWGVNLKPEIANTYTTQSTVSPMALATPTEKQIRILVADDHEMILDVARMYLDQQGDMSVVTVPDLDAALNAFREEGPFDIVILDYQMPGMDGLAGLQKMVALAGDRRRLLAPLDWCWCQPAEWTGRRSLERWRNDVR